MNKIEVMTLLPLEQVSVINVTAYLETESNLTST